MEEAIKEVEVEKVKDKPGLVPLTNKDFEIVDGRTAVVRKIQAKLEQLESIQKEIQETLAEHGKKIDICSIRR